MLRKTIFGKASTITLQPPNTFIGGVASFMGTPDLVATKLRKYPSGVLFTANEINNLTISGDDISFFVAEDYELRQAFQSTVITYYIDKGERMKLLGLNSNFYQCYDFHTAYFPACIKIEGTNQFVFTDKLRNVYLPRCVEYGSSRINNSLFSSTNTLIRKVYVEPTMLTINSGGLEGDLAILRDNVGADIIAVSNFTLPPNPTISVFSVHQKSIKLSFSIGASTNPIDYYEIYVNGVLNNTSVHSTGVAINLTNGVSYNIHVVAVDIYYNKSGVSNTITQVVNGTDITVKSLPQLSYYNASNVHVYYKLNGNANEEISALNGTPTDIVFKNENYNENLTMAEFNGVSSLVTLPDLATYNNSQTVMFWAKLKDQKFANINGFFNKGSDTSGGWGKFVSGSMKTMTTNYVTLSPTVGWSLTSPVQNPYLQPNELFHIATVWDNPNNTAKIYINGVLVVSKVQNGDTLRGTKYVLLGVLANGNINSKYSFLNGSMAEFSIHKTVLTDAQILEAATKN